MIKFISLVTRKIIITLRQKKKQFLFEVIIRIDNNPRALLGQSNGELPRLAVTHIHTMKSLLREYNIKKSIMLHIKYLKATT